MSENCTLFYRRRLPHLFMDNHPVFLTWRLKFTLPSHIVLHLKEMKEIHDKQTAPLSEEYGRLQSYAFHKRVFGYLDKQLDTCRELPDILKQSQFSQIVKESLLYQNGKRYSMHAFCIMPNHVHALITPYSNKNDYKKTLSTITQTWKRHTARQINLLLNRSGSVWSAETYDHLVRSESEFARIVSYILHNPVKANLVNAWEKWTNNWVADEFKEIMG